MNPTYKHRTRLVGLISEAEGQVNNDLPTVEQIADYLLENGVLAPPCKIGDTIYRICTEWRHGNQYIRPIRINQSNYLRYAFNDDENIFTDLSEATAVLERSEK